MTDTDETLQQHMQQKYRILARAKSQPANAATLVKLAGEVASIREVGDD